MYDQCTDPDEGHDIAAERPDLTTSLAQRTERLRSYAGASCRAQKDAR